MSFGPVPVPPWLPELAVAAVGRRLTSNSVYQTVTVGEFLKLKEQSSMALGTNFYTHWARWFCADRTTRTIFPFTKITVPEYVQRRIEENTPESLREAVLLSPTNGLAFPRLARALVARESYENENWLSEADFFSRDAVRLSPDDREVSRIRAEVEQRGKAAGKP